MTRPVISHFTETDVTRPVITQITAPDVTRPVIKVTSVRIAVATATAAAAGYEAGDVSVFLSNDLVADLKELAITACGGGARLKSRQTCSIEGAGSFVEAAAGPGTLKVLNYYVKRAAADKVTI